jgi:hypothetical protein
MSMMPLRLAMPNSVMKPTSEATESTPPLAATASAPPISASGKFTMTSAASRHAPNAITNSTAIPTKATTESPVMVRLACGLALELTAELHVVPRRQREALGELGLHLLRGAAQIAARDVGRDHDAPLGVLAVDQVGPGGGVQVRHRRTTR